MLRQSKAFLSLTVTTWRASAATCRLSRSSAAACCGPLAVVLCIDLCLQARRRCRNLPAGSAFCDSNCRNAHRHAAYFVAFKACNQELICLVPCRIRCVCVHGALEASLADNIPFFKSQFVLNTSKAKQKEDQQPSIVSFYFGTPFMNGHSF